MNPHQSYAVYTVSKLHRRRTAKVRELNLFVEGLRWSARSALGREAADGNGHGDGEEEDCPGARHETLSIAFVHEVL